MIRLLTYLALTTGAAFGLVWLAERPGTVTISWLGAEAEVSVFSAGVILLLSVTALFLVIWGVMALISAPRRLGERMRRRRERKGMQALQEGIFAVGAGDVNAAVRAAHTANRLLPNMPLVRLLRAQAAQLSGDRTAAQRIFTGMLDDPATKLLGLRGLFQEAKRENQLESAQHFAQEALALNPSLSWPVTAQFEEQCRAQDWKGALDTLTAARQYRVIDKATANRRRAVLLTALAIEAETQGDTAKAQELAMEAHKLQPALVPAAAIAGRTLAAAGSTGKAAKVLSTAWEHNPHPDLAIAYTYARPGDSPRDRLTRIKILAQYTPGHPEAAIAVAQAAIDAKEWAEARRALDFLIRERPSARVCTLMARIEHGQNHDAGRVREWLARALRAPRDPVWMADGVVSDEWAPLSPLTGTLDAFVWDVPPERMRPAGMDDRLAEEFTRFESELAEEAIETARLQAVPAAEVRAEEVKPAALAAENAAAPKLKPPVPPAPKPATDKSVTEQTEAAALPTALPASATGWEPEPPAPAQPRAQAPVPAASKDGDAARTPGKTKPTIFVPSRPPDDPGPDSPDSDDSDELHTTLTRFRTPLKGQA